MKSQSEIEEVRKLLYDLVTGNLPVESSSQQDSKMVAATILGLDWVLDTQPSAMLLKVNLAELRKKCETIMATEQSVVVE